MGKIGGPEICYKSLILLVSPQGFEPWTP
jgi:hypothetical protein